MMNLIVAFNILPKRLKTSKINNAQEKKFCLFYDKYKNIRSF